MEDHKTTHPSHISRLQQKQNERQCKGTEAEPRPWSTAALSLPGLAPYQSFPGSVVPSRAADLSLPMTAPAEVGGRRNDT